MAIGSGSGRNVDYEVEPSDPGLAGNQTTDDSLWTLILRFLGLA